MSDNNSPPNTPSDLLKAALSQYCEELEALHQSLVRVSALLSLIRTKGEKERRNFIDQHGRNREETEDSIKFVLDLEQRSEFFKLDREVQNTISAQRLIPRNFIVALVCAYDSFLGKVIRFILEVKPHLLDASEKTLKFSDLLRFSDIAAARDYLTEKEVESVLRRNHVDQFKWLETALGTPFNKGLKSWPAFVELTERRNLFVHCDGVVSSQYLTICSEHKCPYQENLKTGSALHVPADYFQEAYYVLYEIGVKLAQVIWRRLVPDEIEKADTSLVHVTYALIEKGEYGIAIRILEFFTQPHIKHFSDSYRRILIVNLAQAYKWSGDAASCEAILASVDWSASEDKFKLASSILSGDFVAGYKMMRRLVHDEEFHKVYYKEWPLFREFRTQPDFPTVYKECYGEPFPMEETVRSKEAATSSGPKVQTVEPEEASERDAMGSDEKAD